MIGRKSKSSSEERLRNLGDGGGKNPETEWERRLQGLGSASSPKHRSGSGGHNFGSGLRRVPFGKALRVLLALLLVAVIGGAGYTALRYNQIEKVDLADELGGGGGLTGMTVLLVGSDSRNDLASGQSKEFGSGSEVGGQRADTIMLLRIDPSANRVAILSIPRDTYVEVAGEDRSGRINTAFENGPSGLVETIESNFDITVDHYAQVNFDSFRNIVNTVGGVNVNFETPVRDRDPATGKNFSGLNIPEAGCISLGGDTALAYVRSRHYQILQDGRWRADPASDLGRVQRQQEFVGRVVHKAVSQAKTNPLTLNALIGNGVGNMTIDKGFMPWDMASVAWHFQQVEPDQLQRMTLPTTSASRGGAAVLIPQPNASAEAVDQFLNGPPEADPETESVAPADDGAESAPQTTTSTAPNRFQPQETPDCPA